jgi:hypothetical protein
MSRAPLLRRRSEHVAVVFFLSVFILCHMYTVGTCKNYAVNEIHTLICTSLKMSICSDESPLAHQSS